ncbi:hypothetical protein GGR52DRAFT_449691 [Hypoxylon sp. FL1284]|nr:hypothetical protein GGR52DRAFT_449691 [Hypoxylon sp. FL1284]
MGARWSRPRRPAFSEANVGPQEGKVFVVTGGTSEAGLELAKMLYRRGGRVYITGRRHEEARRAAAAIRTAAVPTGDARVDFFLLRLEDFNSVRAAANYFTACEWRLHGLWNYAGVTRRRENASSWRWWWRWREKEEEEEKPLPRSPQGFELHLAANCLGPCMFSQMLQLPLIRAAFEGASNPGSVRVVWSTGCEAATALRCLDMEEIYACAMLGSVTIVADDAVAHRCYLNTRAGILFLAAEFARRLTRAHDIVAVSVDSGGAAAATTRLFQRRRHDHSGSGGFLNRVARALLLLLSPSPSPSPDPAATATALLYAGLSADVGLANSGCHVVAGPSPRVAGVHELRPDLVEAMRPPAGEGQEQSQGGSKGRGTAAEFFLFCVRATRDYRYRDTGRKMRSVS